MPDSGRSAGEGIGSPLQYSWAALVDQLVKNPPATQQPWVQSLGWEDPLEKGTGYPLQYSGHGLYSPQGRKELDTTEQLSLSSLEIYNWRDFPCGPVVKNLPSNTGTWVTKLRSHMPQSHWVHISQWITCMLQLRSQCSQIKIKHFFNSLFLKKYIQLA